MRLARAVDQEQQRGNEPDDHAGEDVDEHDTGEGDRPEPELGARHGAHGLKLPRDEDVQERVDDQRSQHGLWQRLEQRRQQQNGDDRGRPGGEVRDL